MADATIAKAYVQIVPSTKGIQGELEKGLSGSAESAGKTAGSKFASAMGTAAKVGLAAIGTASTMVAGFVKTAVDGFAEYEQLAGGVETLFDNSDKYEATKEQLLGMGYSAEEAARMIATTDSPIDTVMKNAANAYKTAGLSANEYMEAATSMAAALNASTGDEAKSAEYVNMAITDMSDNANKMGSSMESIQNAYNGFSKGNFTMLDNLKLGFGGTKEEMQRLLEEASKISGVKYDISSYADIVDAIHVVQTEMGITGTTASEASTTIQGSLSMMQGAWANLVSGIATDGANLDTLIYNFVESVGTFGENIMPAIETALAGVSTLIEKLAPVVAAMIPELVSTCLPSLISAGVSIIGALGQALLDNIDVILSTGLEILTNLGNSIISALPTLIPAVVSIVLAIVEFLVNNIDLLIDAAIQLIVALGVGLINALPQLVAKIPTIIMSLATAIQNGKTQIFNAGKALLLKMGEAITAALPTIVAKARALITSVVSAIKEKVQNFISIGKDIVNGIKQGLADAWESLTTWFSTKISSLADKAKELLKIGSPSKVFANEVGKWIPAGIAQGIENGMGVLNSAMDDMDNYLFGSAYNANATITTGYDSARMMSSGSTTSDSVADLLATYLPIIARGDNINVTLEGDAKALFKSVKATNNVYTRTTGRSAFA